MTLSHLEKWATWSEILSQPTIWRQWALDFDPAPITNWIQSLGARDIWLTGAGTSAYVGEIIAAGLEGSHGQRVRAIASTDIVSRPHAYLSGQSPLVVSFGRSGDSTETIGVLDALDALAPHAPRLNITCNANGALATRTSSGPQKTIVLPDATHDSGFAMTSSFSTMLLSALAVLDSSANFSDQMAALADGFDALFATLPRQFSPPPARVVFVGAGPLAFAAREAALKVMELSAGKIPALWDSTLGFRHGPKSFVTDDTAIFLFASCQKDTRRYDDDLASELRQQFPKAQVLVVATGGDINLEQSETDTWAAPLAISVAQAVAVHWSDQLGLNVDTPFEGQGTLTRVVSGVTLYPVAP